MNEYTIVIEDAGSNYAAYVLDFDGCVSTGSTIEEVTDNMREAITMHIEAMVEHGESVPTPVAFVGTAKVVV
jgi:predicted RNase H-like HicB family nuclease